MSHHPLECSSRLSCFELRAAKIKHTMKPMIANALRPGNCELRPMASNTDIVPMVMTENNRRFRFPTTYAHSALPARALFKAVRR